MSVFDFKKGGFMDQIRCDEKSYLIWKWRPRGNKTGENERENSIRWGSSLRVKDGEVAVFVYKQPGGMFQDFIEGPFDEKIETKNFPVLARIVGLAYDGGTPFQAEIYFINLTKIIQTRFAVPYFDVYDPRFLDFGVPVAIRGTITFSIKDYKHFIKLHRLNTFDLTDFQNEIKDLVCRYAKDIVINAPSKNNIPLVQIETKISQINDEIEYCVKQRLEEDFGVTVSGVDISNIDLDITCDSYAQLMKITKDVVSEKIKAETEAKLKDISDKQRIEIENYQEMLRVQREEAQYAQHKQTQTSNFGAFQTEKQAEVGIAGANALGQMGSNGAGNINLSGGGGNAEGFNMAAMMASMAVGGVVGQNIAGSMNSMMSGVNVNNQTIMTPPPLPVSLYYVAVNGHSSGPFDLQTIKNMYDKGMFKLNDLVWKQGMSDWAVAESIEEIKDLIKR